MRSQAHGALELAALRDPTHMNACLRACGHVRLLAKLGAVMRARVGAQPCVGAGRTALASLCGAAHGLHSCLAGPWCVCGRRMVSVRARSRGARGLHRDGVVF